MTYLVYTSVFGGYDRIFPPLIPESNVDYVIVTDDPALKVEGWRTHLVDVGGFASTSLANRYYKMLMYDVCSGYQASLYVDGNIRITGPMSDMFARFIEADVALKLFAHPQRGSVKAEVEHCIMTGQAFDPAGARAELAGYLADGFTDDLGLVEATILLKRHDIAGLDQAMQMWWELYRTHQNRDQFSLPYVLWKTGVSHSFHDFNFREPNPWFGMYPHRGDPEINARYADLYARSYDSLVHRGLLGMWHGTWAVRRWLRRRLKQV